MSPTFVRPQKLARTRGRNGDALARLYVLEGMLDRIFASPFAADFESKGGVLLAACALLWPTKDIDVEVSRIRNDATAVTARITEIADIGPDDGIAFDLDSIPAETIRENDDYQGIRVRLTGYVGRYRSAIGLDVSFGDPIWPAPQQIDIPRILEDIGVNPVILFGYPLIMVFAEKTVTRMQRRETSTRWRDFADVVVISRRHNFIAGDRRSAMEVVANHRREPLLALVPGLDGMAELAQTKAGDGTVTKPVPKICLSYSRKSPLSLPTSPTQSFTAPIHYARGGRKRARGHSCGNVQNIDWRCSQKRMTTRRPSDPKAAVERAGGRGASPAITWADQTGGHPASGWPHDR
jgi:hypothetical protein